LTCLKKNFLIKTNYLIQPRITALVFWLAKRMANQMTQNYGANIWNEYIFLLKCNMARIWTQNVYFSLLLHTRTSEKTRENCNFKGNLCSIFFYLVTFFKKVLMVWRIDSFLAGSFKIIYRKTWTKYFFLSHFFSNHRTLSPRRRAMTWENNAI
jgi:hypothetical protein